jgi:integrase
MASLDKHKKGGWRIRFIVNDKRYDFYPGKKLTKRQANEVCLHVAKLERSVNFGVEVDAKTVLWVQGISEKHLANLKKKGLIATDEMTNPKKVWTLNQLIEFYKESLEGRKPGSVKKWQTVFNHLDNCGFGETLLSDLTEYDAKLFVKYLVDRGGICEFTRNRYSGFAKQMLEDAVELRLIPINPFRKLVTTAPDPNDDRQVEISTEASLAILNACPDWEWRLIFGLMRWGGLRCPSELKIKWSEVLQDRFLVHSPKTEHRAGKENRWTPMFKELEPLFQEAYDMANDGAVYVLGQRRNSGHKALTDQYLKILMKAGVSVYPKPFTNLRSSRVTELTRSGLPPHLESAWFGHSEKVARKNYIQTNDADFAQWSAMVPHATGLVPQKVPQTVAANQ